MRTKRKNIKYYIYVYKLDPPTQTLTLREASSRDEGEGDLVREGEGKDHHAEESERAREKNTERERRTVREGHTHERGRDREREGGDRGE